MQFSNYNQHPTNSNYLVFTYTKQNMSDYFKQLLEEKNIPYQYEGDKDSNSVKHYIGVKKEFEKEAIQLNYLAFGKFRNPFIKSKIGKTALLIFFLSLLGIAITGYIKTRL